MTYVDDAILDFTESLCRRFQRLTGRTNVWLAVQLTNVSIIVFFVWAGLQFLSAGVQTRVVLGTFCGVLLVVLAQTILAVPIETHENSAYKRVANGLRNPRRLQDAPLRISFLTLSVVLLFPLIFLYGDLLALTLRSEILLLGYSLVVLTTVVLYLLACDPLPPCAGWVREWLRGTTAARTAVPESPGDLRCNFLFLALSLRTSLYCFHARRWRPMATGAFLWARVIPEPVGLQRTGDRQPGGRRRTVSPMSVQWTIPCDHDR